jgi:hypothetical protein
MGLQTPTFTTSASTQLPRAANPLIKSSPGPVAQQATTNGVPKGPLDEAQHPEPNIAANPTRPSTCQVL